MNIGITLLETACYSSDPVNVLPRPEVPVAPAVGTLLFSCVLCERCSSHALSAGGGAGFLWPPQPDCEPVCFSVATHRNPLKTLTWSS